MITEYKFRLYETLTFSYSVILDEVAAEEINDYQNWQGMQTLPEQFFFLAERSFLTTKLCLCTAI